MIRLIQIGLGGWGRDWAASVTSRLAGVEPVAWVDLDADTRKQAVDELGIAPDRVHSSLASALDGAQADAALVVVPTVAHAAAATEALDKGLHVLVEKPFTDTLGEAQTLLALARQRRQILMVNQNYRWFPAPILARRLIEEAAIGTPVAAYIDFHRFYGPSYRYFSLAQPLLSDMAIHHFDGLRYVLQDEPAEISCLSWTEPGLPFAGPPAALATIRMRRGTLVSYRASWISRGSETPFGGQWRLDGTRGRIDFQFRGVGDQRNSFDELVLHTGSGSTSPSLPDVPARDRAGALTAFATWIRNGEPPEGTSTAADNLRSLALVHAAVRSAAANGAWVRIDDLIEEARP